MPQIENSESTKNTQKHTMDFENKNITKLSQLQDGIKAGDQTQIAELKTLIEQLNNQLLRQDNQYLRCNFFREMDELIELLQDYLKDYKLIGDADFFKKNRQKQLIIKTYEYINIKMYDAMQKYQEKEAAGLGYTADYIDFPANFKFLDEYFQKTMQVFLEENLSFTFNNLTLELPKFSLFQKQPAEFLQMPRCTQTQMRPFE